MARRCARGVYRDYPAAPVPNRTLTLLETFEIDPERAEPEMAPDCNVAPTKTSPVVIARVPKDTDDEQPQRQLRNLKWGLLPN